MNILMKMYQGSFVLESDNNGRHLVNDDDVTFCIWVNANETFNRKVDFGDMVNVPIMTRTIYDCVYRGLGNESNGPSFFLGGIS